MYDVCVCVSQSPSSLYMHKRRVTGTSETLTVVTWGGGESSEVWTLDVRSILGPKGLPEAVTPPSHRTPFLVWEPQTSDPYAFAHKIPPPRPLSPALCT